MVMEGFWIFPVSHLTLLGDKFSIYSFIFRADTLYILIADDSLEISNFIYWIWAAEKMSSAGLYE